MGWLGGAGGGHWRALAGTGGKYVPSLHISRHHCRVTYNFDYDGMDQLYRNRASSAQTARLPDGSYLLTTQNGAGLEHNRTPTLGF